MRRAVIIALVALALGRGIASASQICAVNVSTNFATAMADPRITCGVFYIQWDVIEPTKGVFDWSTVDAEIALIPAGKKYWLDLWPAEHTPAWVYTDGAVAFSFIWPFFALQGGALNWPTVCSTVKTPRPWDTTYATDWESFLAAAATRYANGRVFADGVENSTTTLTSATAAFVSGDVGRLVSGNGIVANTTIASVTNGTTVILSNAALLTQTTTITLGDPKLAGVKLNPFGSFTQEIILPSNTTTNPIKNATGTTICFTNNDAANWTAAGYTVNLIETAFNNIAAAYIADFPTLPLSLQFIPIGFPFETNIENGGGPVKDLGPTERLLLADCLANVPNCEAQNDGWSQTNIIRSVNAYQEGGQLGNQLTLAWVVLLNKLNFVPKRYEIFDIDAVNPANNNILNVMAFNPPKRYGAGEW